MREPDREAIAKQTLAFATTPCEAIVFSSKRALTRFTQNAIHQNLASDDTTVRVRVIAHPEPGAGDGTKTGVAETNDLSSESLRATVARALAIASFAPLDTTTVPLAFHAPLGAPPNAFDDVAATASPEYRARIVANILAPVEAAKQWAAGYATTASDGITIANTQGTLVSFDGTSAAANVKSNAADSTGYAEHFATNAGALDGTALGTTASTKASLGAQPLAVDPGDWTVILEPAAFGELLSYLTEHFSAQAVDEGSSFLCDGLDRTYAHANFTLTDDYAHPLHAGMPFDYEGYPRERVTLIDRGVARAYVTDATWAAKLNRPNTGHGLPAPSADGPRPLHLVVASGTKSVDELIAQTPRAF